MGKLSLPRWPLVRGASPQPTAIVAGLFYRPKTIGGNFVIVTTALWAVDVTFARRFGEAEQNHDENSDDDSKGKNDFHGNHDSPLYCDAGYEQKDDNANYDMA